MALTMPKMPAFKMPQLFGATHYVGLDLGGQSIKLVWLKDSGKARQLVKWAVEEIPGGGDEQPPDQRAEALARLLKKLFADLKLSGRKVATSLSEAVVIRYVKLPFQKPEELAAVIRTEAEQHIPLPMDQAAFSHQILGEVTEENQKKLEVLLVAVKSEQVDQHLEVLQKAGLKPGLLDVDTFALQNAYESAAGVEAGETVALVHLGARLSLVNVLEDGVSHFSRDFNVAGSQMTKELMREFKLTFGQAEELKKQQGILLLETDEVSLASLQNRDDQSARISEALLPVANKVLSELRRSFDFYENSIKKRAISKVVLSGGTARLKNLDRFLSEKLGLPVLVMDPLRNVQVDLPAGELERLKEFAPMLAVSAGLALRRVA
jgi:type IV pilus assembly protein PilM